MNTPDPNPSPELIEAAREILKQVDRMPPTTSRTVFYPEETVIAALVLALSPQTLPAPGEVDYAGMLQTAWESCPSGDGLGLPPIIFSDAEAAHIVRSLATVAAANDEGVAEAIEAAVNVALKHAGTLDLAQGHDDAEGQADRWYEGGKHSAQVIAAAIRLLPQGGGRA